MNVSRKHVLQLLIFGVVSSTNSLFAGEVSSAAKIPGYLKGYESQWEKDPKAANLAWFKEAQLGMFIHFSPASGIGNSGWGKLNSDWAQMHRKNASLSPEEYGAYLLDKFEPRFMTQAAKERIYDFTGEKFDADKIARLAVETGMKYITFTSQHVNGCLFMFDTMTSDLNSVKLTPKRDFVAEMAQACEEHDLGLFLYVMPPYVDPSVKDLNRQMLTELLTNYGPIAGIWFDGIGEAMRRPQSFDLNEVSATYALVRKLQPHCLISYKTGYTGEEDFIAPEQHHCKYDKDGLPTFERKNAPERMAALWESNLRYKYIQSSYTLLAKNTWFSSPDAKYRSAEEIVERYRRAREMDQSLLLNITPLYDGSLHPNDVKILQAVGRQR